VLSPPACLFLTFRQVLTGEAPFRHLKLLELAHHVSRGLRPVKPVNVKTIGISDSLWHLIQECWDGERTRRPRIQEVVAAVGDAAINWHTDMPPGNMEGLEDSVVEEESDEVMHGEFSLFPIVPMSPQTFCTAGIFQSYQTTVAGHNADASGFGHAHTAPTEPTENFAAVFKHLEQNSASPPTALPPRRRKGFKLFLNKIFVAHKNKSGH